MSLRRSSNGSGEEGGSAPRGEHDQLARSIDARFGVAGMASPNYWSYIVEMCIGSRLNGGNLGFAVARNRSVEITGSLSNSGMT